MPWPKRTRSSLRTRLPDRTIGALLDSAARVLRSNSSSPRLDAELLLAHVLGVERVDVLAHPERAVPSAAFEGLVERRAAGEPIAYLIGEREFYGRSFNVDHRALIPRPETELLVELGVAAISRWRAINIEPRVVDIGTGAGAIALSVALEAHLPVVATDVSYEALTLARDNAHGLGAEVALVQADLLAGVAGPFHIVLANLPYVPRDRELPRDVKDFEPHVALFGGTRGTELIERLLRQACDVLVPGGELCVELDEEEQAAPVAALAQTLYPGAGVSVCQDNGGYDRVVRVSLPPAA
jgi:release factor glutamine methyltransferase